ncbi:hypothetical protein DNTS_021350 [Danionella cerebrum]|uniref:Lipase maturation factor n=1 Tax=Danionella cerebrum TaxID=2873325 RepID=A0A553QXY4_9TELE|nr:hypothetical protein DNTS_021350 [Danionella translucida]
MSPSPLAWYVRQLPDWLLRLGAVVLLHSGICVPLLTTFAPIRRLRLFGFYVQLFIQLFHILIGNCSLLNLLTVALSFSLLDDEHFSRKKGLEKKLRGCSQVLGSFVVLLVELAIYVLIVFSAVMLYKLQIDWEHKAVTAKTGAHYLDWCDVIHMGSCRCHAQVPYSTLPGMSSTIVLPRLRDLHQAVEKYQLVGAYGVKHIMISEGRPEIILEGSNDGQTWIEMNSEFKPGNVNALPAIAGPHQPRLEWMMWQAAQGGLQQSPWFVGLVQRLLQGKPDVVGLLQSDEARYPFSQKPPALIRAKLYHYQLTHAAKDNLNDPKLHTLLDESGLKEKSPLQPVLETSVSQALSLIRNPIKGLSGALVIWTLFASLASIVLLKVVFSSCTGRQKSRSTAAEHKHRKAKEPCEAAEKSASNRAAKKDSSERKVDSDKSPRKRKTESIHPPPLTPQQRCRAELRTAPRSENATIALHRQSEESKETRLKAFNVPMFHMREVKIGESVCLSVLLLSVFATCFGEFGSPLTDDVDTLETLSENIPSDYRIPIRFITKDVGGVCWLYANLYPVESALKNLTHKFGIRSNIKVNITIFLTMLQGFRFTLGDDELEVAMDKFHCHYRSAKWPTRRFFNHVKEVLTVAGSKLENFETCREFTPPPCKTLAAPPPFTPVQVAIHGLLAILILPSMALLILTVKMVSCSYALWYSEEDIVVLDEHMKLTSACTTELKKPEQRTLALSPAVNRKGWSWIHLGVQTLKSNQRGTRGNQLFPGLWKSQGNIQLRPSNCGLKRQTRTCGGPS